MALEMFVTGEEDYGQWMKALIGGAPGAGKTLLSSTFPNPIFASAEGGLMSVARRRLRGFNIRHTDELKQLRERLDQPADVLEKMFRGPVETLVVDTIDEIQRLFVQERMKAKRLDIFDQQSWGWLGTEMRSVLRGLRNLDLNVVFTVHLKETTDQNTGQMYFKPSLQGAVGDEIAQYMDLALLLRSETKPVPQGNIVVQTERRYLQTYKDAQHDWIKDRSGQLPAEFEVNFEDDYARMHKLIFGFIGEDLAKAEKHAVEALAEVLQPSTTGTGQEGGTVTGVLGDMVETSVSETPVDILTTAAKGREEPAEVVQPEPDPEATPEPEKTTETSSGRKPVSNDEQGPWTCEKCGSEFDSLDQMELSQIMLQGRILDAPCYREEQAKK